jgi:phosphotransacetylase
MAAATERVVVLMTPAEKRTLERKAKRIGASAAELVRRSVESFDPDADETEIEHMLEILTQSHQKTLAALDRAEREVAETRAYFSAKPKGASREHR